MYGVEHGACEMRSNTLKPQLLLPRPQLGAPATESRSDVLLRAFAQRSKSRLCDHGDLTVERVAEGSLGSGGAAVADVLGKSGFGTGSMTKKTTFAKKRKPKMHGKSALRPKTHAVDQVCQDISGLCSCARSLIA